MKTALNPDDISNEMGDWLHDHVFDQGSETAERSTRLVMWITAAMMVLEIAAGWLYNSMSLLADGWHMSSHALAIGLSATAYVAARTYAQDPRFAFGTWKIEVLAIVALLGGWLYGWSWLDPVVGIVGAVLVALWAKNQLLETGKVLLDREMNHPVVQEIREVVEADAQTLVTDLHVWRVGKKVYACALAVVTRDTRITPQMLRERLAVHEEIIHSTIEIHQRG